MGKKVKSARGEFIDFDLLKIKEQIAAAPPPVDVQQRKDFVEKRLRRRVKKKMGVESVGEINVEPKLPSPTEAVAVDPKPTKVEPKKETPAEPAPKTKQRARKKKA